ncbi:MAG: SDR family NAD(P)-dependent oxidoreductase [Novosphingobium sp.]
MPELNEQTCLITGAASGIGAATARMLAARAIGGLILIDRDKAALAALELPCRTKRLIGDVADEALWARVEAEAGPFNLALLNAGIADAAALDEIEFAAWRRVLSVNLDGLLLSLRCAMRTMRDSGGAIVITGSAGGIKPEPGTAAYGASKAAAHHLARVAAKEGAPHGIRVNAIAPGGVDTAIWNRVPFFQDLCARHGGDRAAAISEMGAVATPLGRYASASEIAGQIGFLLSDDAATITGAVLVSDGGYSV